MMNKLVRFGLLLVMALLVMSAPVAAHEGRETGDYVLNFGWQVEPAYAGIMNGPELRVRVEDAPEGEAFPEDLEVALQAEVTFGSEMTTISFRPAQQEPGHFVAVLVPTLPGDYVFRIFGTIGDTAVDETFDSAAGEFSKVEPSADIMFPSMGALDARMAALEARIAELEAQVTELQGE